MRFCAAVAVAMLFTSSLGASQSPIIGVFGFSDGRIIKAAVADLDETAVNAVQFAWLWSQQAAPVRLRGDAFRELRLKILGVASSPAAHVMEVTIEQRKPFPESTSLIAAPPEMWQEVPEPLLPTWPLDEEGQARLPAGAATWRMRVTSARAGTWWTDVTSPLKKVVLRPANAVTKSVHIEQPDQKPAAGVDVFVSQQPQGSRRATPVARFRSDVDGNVQLVALPDGEPVVFVVRDRRFAPAVVSGRVPDIARIRLARGLTLRGRLVDAEKKPVADAAIHVAAWIAEEPRELFGSDGKTTGDGTFALEHLPHNSSFRIHKAGFADIERRLEDPDADVADLGTVTLTPSVQARLRVVDDRGEPVPRAQVVRESRVSGVTDARGRITIEDVAAGRPFSLSIARDGYVAKRLTVTPSQRETDIRIDRAFHVSAAVIDEVEMPVPDGSVATMRGNEQTTSAFRGGRLELDVPSDHSFRMLLNAAGHQPAELVVPAGRAGETLMLPDIVMQRGFVVSGRIISTSGVPVAGARVWVPQPSPQGVVYSWMRGNVASTESNTNGEFTLSGLLPQRTTIRIDASALARTQVDVQPDIATASYDLGTIVMQDGSLVRVRTDAADGAVARVDVRGEWLDFDMITGLVADGTAVIRHVPSGKAVVTVVDRGAIVCEQTVEVSSATDVSCSDSKTRVDGEVFSGSTPATGGMLIWSAESSARVQGVIYTRTVGGVSQTSVYGAGRPPVAVEVDESGRFSARVSPGSWSVTWLPPTGGTTSPQRVSVGATSIVGAVLRYGTGTVNGIVTDRDGQPVVDAVVRDLDTRAAVRTTAGGEFRFVGLSAGTRLQAQLASRYSDVYVMPSGDAHAEGVRLLLHDPTVVRVAISADGVPAAGARVFFSKNTSAPLLQATADVTGVATAELGGEWTAVRVAAWHRGRWMFGRWTDRANAHDDLTLQVGATGTLTVPLDSSSWPMRLFTSDGWEVSAMINALGTHVRDERMVHIDGLPAGSYTAVTQHGVKSVTIKSGEETTLGERAP